MANQLVYPTSDISAGSWTTAPLWSKIDEEPYSDTDYVACASVAAPSAFTVALGDPADDPVIHTGHVLDFRYRRSGSGGIVMTVELLQGASVIATSGNLSPSTAFIDGQITLTEGEAANITDYTDLRVRGTLVSSAGSAAVISWVRLTIPPYTVRTPACYLHARRDRMNIKGVSKQNSLA
jgi:hypothetical protein